MTMKKCFHFNHMIKAVVGEIDTERKTERGRGGRQRRTQRGREGGGRVGGEGEAERERGRERGGREGGGRELIAEFNF